MLYGDSRVTTIMSSSTIILLLCLVLCLSALAKEKCSIISVQWQCEQDDKTMQQTCCDSLDKAIDLTENQAKHCQGQLQVNMTFISTSQGLSRNVTLSNTRFSHLSFLGAPNTTKIHCKSASLRFDGSDETRHLKIQIQRMVFISCGPGDQALPAALFFNDNCQVELSDILVEDSNGSGLALVHITDGVNVTKSSFARNKFKGGRGAGVHVTLNFTANETESHATYSFTHCVFEDNEAQPYTVPKNPLKGFDTRGGGLFIHYEQYTYNISVLVLNCTFSGNMAHWGAGLLGSFTDNSSYNHLHIISSTFNNNHWHINSKSPYVAGAGAMINVFLNSSFNMASIHNCTFTGNVASWGGGLEFYSKPAFSRKRIQHSQNLLKVSQCRFENNVAYNGAAVNIYCSSPASSPESCNVNPVLSDSNFTSNGNPSLVSSFNQIVGSIIMVKHFPTLLEGTLIFSNNSGSPLHIHESSVTLNKSTTLKFYNNSAHNGGAITLYGSWIAVSKNSKLVFSNNTAADKGGAIYAYMTEEAFLPYVHRCFIRYASDTVQRKRKFPWEWDANFIFSNNIASDTPEAIYATSILPCVWEKSNTSTLDYDIKATFCLWNKWHFDSGNCSNEIHTSARNFSSTPHNVTVFPGVPSVQFLSAVDDFGHNVSNITINPTVLSNNNSRAQSINRSLIVYGQMYTSVKILLELEGDRPTFMIVNVSLLGCPPAFSFDSSSLSCRCNSTRQIYCMYNAESHWIAYLITGFCMSYSQINYECLVVFGRCPFTSGLHSSQNTYTPYLRLPLKKEELDTKFCGKFNRTGILCGECMQNYSIDVFSDTFQCHNCSGSLTKWLFFITVEGLPPLLFFVIVVLLHISFTSGPANGFIFFGQVLTVALEVIIFRSSWMESSVKHPLVISDTMVNLYSIWSLDFFRLVRLFNENYKMCLGHDIKVIHVLALRYISALYPLCFLVFAFTVIELHARNCRILVWLWKPLCFLCVRFRQAWKARTSVVDAFAAFILLSYVKLVRISLLLLTFSSIYDPNYVVVKRVVNYDPTVGYLSAEHAPFAVIGALFLLTFGLIPPLLLTFYQFPFFQRCLNRCKLNRNGLRIFMDAFQGCYKDAKNGGPDRRYFSGLYFIFRLIVFAIFDMTSSLPVTYLLLLVAFTLFGFVTALVQPYKKSFYTFLDIFFFNILATIMALHLYTLYVLGSDSHSPVSLTLLSTLFSLTMIPMVYITFFVLYWLYKRAPVSVRRNIQRSMHMFRKLFTYLSKHLQPNEYQHCRIYAVPSETTTDDIPDRLANSFRYRSLTLQSIVPTENEKQSD